ncbi:hypothetical protein ACFU98_17765 [Streptomyces sp. NPDC057575]
MENAAGWSGGGAVSAGPSREQEATLLVPDGVAVAAGLDQDVGGR